MKETIKPGICRACHFGVGHDFDLAGAWLGWRLRGGFLVSPDGDKITPGRLRGICTTEALQLRRRRLQATKSKRGVSMLATPPKDPARDPLRPAADRRDIDKP